MTIDSVENFLVGCSQSNHGEVIGETQVNDEGTRLGVKATQEHNVLNGLLLFQVVTIENKLVIKNLTDQTDWRLCSILVKFWHVQVIHEEHKDLTGWWSENLTHALFDVGFDNSLEGLGVGVGVHGHA